MHSHELRQAGIIEAVFGETWIVADNEFSFSVCLDLQGYAIIAVRCRSGYRGLERPLGTPKAPKVQLNAEQWRLITELAHDSPH